MNIIQSLEWRYATKKFDPSKKLNNQQLNTLQEAFNLTATSYGLQTVALVVVDNKELREAILPNAYNQRQVVDASHLLVICYPDTYNQNDVATYFESVEQIRKTPSEILAPFKNYLMDDIAKKSLEEKHDMFVKQAYITLGNLLTVCAVEKIDACPMEGFKNNAIDEILNLQQYNLKSALLLPVGFRAADDFMAKEKKVRKKLEDIIITLS